MKLCRREAADWMISVPNRAKLARQVTRLLCEKNRIVTFFTAVLLLCAAGAAGNVLAGSASGIVEKLRHSEIIEGLLPSKEDGFAAHIFSTPENVQAFLQYFNAIAPAVTNLDQPITSQVQCFVALMEASRTSGVKLGVFSANEQEDYINVLCEAPDRNYIEVFMQLLRESGQFSRVERAENSQENEQEYTIRCYFKPPFSV